MTRKVNYFQEGGNIPEYDTTAEFEDYRLQKGDYVYIRVNTLDMEAYEMFNGNIRITSMSSMTSDNAVARLYLYLVGEDGCINYPYVGKISVQELMIRDVKLLLERELKSIVTDCSVDVKLSNRTFSVIGESVSGRYPLPKEKMTIYEALSMSGDLSLYADRKNVQIIRETADGTVVKTFDIRSKTIVNSEFYYIQPNDVIYIPFSNNRYWGASHFTNVLSMTFSTVSFGLLIYSIVSTIVKSANAANP